MSNNYFQFRQFTVRHDLCAMKVGTDGVLLGAWAEGGERVLDIGTGSGLIALCMAQRYPQARITAIDIDKDACRQAAINAEQSPFAGRIDVVNIPLQQFDGGVFDAIVCNPPFFKDSLHCPDPKRTLARHASALTASDLFRHAARMLSDGGTVSVVIPSALRGEYDSEALFAGLTPARIYNICTVERKQPCRSLAAYRKGAANRTEEKQVYIRDNAGNPSAWYKTLTADFYLNNL